MTMEPRVSIITLSVADLDRAAAFYEAMGLTRNEVVADGVAFFQMGGAILGLFPRQSAEEDSGVAFAKAPSAVVRSEAKKSSSGNPSGLERAVAMT